MICLPPSLSPSPPPPHPYFLFFALSLYSAMKASILPFNSTHGKTMSIVNFFLLKGSKGSFSSCCAMVFLSTIWLLVGSSTGSVINSLVSGSTNCAAPRRASKNN